MCPMDRMDQMQTAYLLCTRITPETTTLRVIWEKYIQIMYSLNKLKICRKWAQVVVVELMVNRQPDYRLVDAPR